MVNRKLFILIFMMLCMINLAYAIIDYSYNKPIDDFNDSSVNSTLWSLDSHDGENTQFINISSLNTGAPNIQYLYMKNGFDIFDNFSDYIEINFVDTYCKSALGGGGVGTRRVILTDGTNTNIIWEDNTCPENNGRTGQFYLYLNKTSSTTFKVKVNATGSWSSDYTINPTADVSIKFVTNLTSGTGAMSMAIDWIRFVNTPLSTNLTTTTESWPVSFDVNLSLSRTQTWSEQPNCSIQDNVSWLNCNPASIIMPSENSTSFTCIANEKNSGSVLMYGNCKTDIQEYNSTSIEKIIYADAHPEINISPLVVYTEAFNFNITGINISEIMNCEVLDTNEYISCDNFTLSINNTLPSYNHSSCTISDSISEEFNAMVSCYSTNYLGINSTNDTFFADFIQPQITLNYPNISGSTKIKNNTAFNWNISINDSNVFGFEINCSFNGETQYHDLITDIDVSVYNYTNSTILRNVGLHTCNVSASDDHTANIFDVPIEKKDTIFGFIPIDESLATKTSGKIGDLDFEIDKSSVSLTTNIIKRQDRVSLEFNLEGDGKKNIPVTFKCPYTAYKRTSKYKEHWVCSNGIYGYWIDGDTKEKGVEVISDYDSKTGIIRYIYVTSGSKVTMDSIGGLNFNSILFNITTEYWDNVTFTAYDKWNGEQINTFNLTVYNSTNSTSFNVTTGSVTMNLPNGPSYTVNQTTPWYVFGNLSSSHVVGSTKIYNTSFWQSQLTVSYYDRILDQAVTGVSALTNITGISYNNDSFVSGSSITYYIDNGTFITSANKSGSGLVTNTLSSSDYIDLGESLSVQLNFTRYYNVSLMREETNVAFNMSESNTSNVSVKIVVICEEKDLTYTLNASTANFETIDCNWEDTTNPDNGWYILVDYPESEVDYYRYVVPDANSSNVTIWLLELQTGDTVVEHEISLTDLGNEYDQGYLVVETDVPGAGYVEVIKQRFDMQKKVNLFLQENERYRYYVINNDGDVSSVSYFTAATAESTIVQPNIVIGSNDTYATDTFDIDYELDDGVLTVSLNSTDDNNFSEVIITLLRYNITSGRNYSDAILYGDYETSVVSTINYSNFMSVEINYTLDSDYGYLLNAYCAKGDDEFPINSTKVITVPGTFTFLGFEDYTEHIKLWVATGTIIGIIMIGTVTSIEWIMMIAFVVAGIFIKFGWFAPLEPTSKLVTYGTLSLITIIFAVLVIYSMIRKGKKFL